MKFFRGLTKWGLPLRLSEEISEETRKVGEGAGMTTVSYLRSRVDIKDRTLQGTRFVRVFTFLCFGGQGGRENVDGYGNGGKIYYGGGGS